MKFAYSFFFIIGLMFGFVPNAEANHGQVAAVVYHKTCSTHRQWVSSHHNRHGRWVPGHYRQVESCRGHRTPKVVVHKHNGCHGFHHGHSKPNLRLVVHI